MQEVQDAMQDRGMEVNTIVASVSKANETYEAMTITLEGSNVEVNMIMNVSSMHMKMVGHKDISTTMHIYVEATNEKKKEVAAKPITFR